MYEEKAVEQPKEVKEFLNNLNEMIEKPFVTARFGDNWQELIKEQMLNGETDIDIIIRTAWKQGRKAILLERALKEYASQQREQPKEVEGRKSAEEMLRDGINDGSYADILDTINVEINTPNLLAICCFAEDYHAQFPAIDLREELKSFLKDKAFEISHNPPDFYDDIIDEYLARKESK